MQFPIADGHCDFLFGAMEYGYDIRTHTREQVMNLAHMQDGNVRLQVFACWADKHLKTPPMQQCLEMIDRYRSMLEQNADTLVPFSRGYDPACGKIATVLAVEGGEVCNGSLAALRVLYRLGVRAMTFTWNENNELASAGMDRRDRGLTPLGEEFLAEMSRIGIAFDVSHLSDKGIDDALRLSTRPIFASHSNARAVKDTPRGLSDAHIRAIAEKGGVIGVNFYGPQLCDASHARIADIVRHIRHVTDVGGVGCCAIGSDFDGMSVYPVDLHTSADLPALCEALLADGFSEEDVMRIAYRNLAAYLAEFV